MHTVVSFLTIEFFLYHHELSTLSDVHSFTLTSCFIKRKWWRWHMRA